MKEFVVERKITVEEVHDLLVSALEGGSNYWYMIEDKIKPTSIEWRGNPSLWEKEIAKDPTFLYTGDYALNPGGALIISDAKADDPELDEPEKWVTLDLAAIEKGLQAWAADAQKSDDDKTRTSHPSYFYEFLKGDADAEVADLFLQYCVFGKVIYG